MGFLRVFCNKWRALLKDKAYVVSLIIGFVLLFVGQAATVVSSEYNETMFLGESVGDLILDFLPTYNLNFLFTWGTTSIITTIILYAFFVRPELAPWGLKTYGLFALIRSGFILLTHIGPPAGMYYLSNDSLAVQGHVFDKIFYLNDLFFSGHVGAVFLGALIFKDFKFKWFCLVGSVVVSITVLVMHVHYSIDVFGAYFITYGIYSISDWLFHKYTERFKKIIENISSYKFGKAYKP